MTDNRHEIAENLREQARCSSVFPSDWWNRLQTTVMGGPVYYDPQKTCLVIADLIDPGICHNIYNEKEFGACVNGFECSECGCKVEDCEGYYVKGEWNWCPKCGRMVVND